MAECQLSLDKLKRGHITRRWLTADFTDCANAVKLNAELQGGDALGGGMEGIGGGGGVGGAT